MGSIRWDSTSHCSSESANDPGSGTFRVLRYNSISSSGCSNLDKSSSSLSMKFSSIFNRSSIFSSESLILIGPFFGLGFFGALPILGGSTSTKAEADSFSSPSTGSGRLTSGLARSLFGLYLNAAATKYFIFRGLPGPAFAHPSWNGPAVSKANTFNSRVSGSTLLCCLVRKAPKMQ